MNWLQDCLNELERSQAYSYYPGQASATEPAALAALALLAHDRPAAARRALEWLANAQQAHGALGVTRDLPDPSWPTAWALLAWCRARVTDVHLLPELDRHIATATSALLAVRGQAVADSDGLLGHDHGIIAWPWVAGTHSWLEPTALAVMALKAAALGSHERTREGVRLLIDRQLPGGGCNYGNTTVLGRQLRAHWQPSGMALVALADEPEQPQLAATREFLSQSWPQATAPASLAWSLLGLAAHTRLPPSATAALEVLFRRRATARFSTYHAALVALAAAGADRPLNPRPTPARS